MEAKESGCKTDEAEAEGEADMDSLSGVSSNGSVARSENSITSGSSNASQGSDTVNCLLEVFF